MSNFSADSSVSIDQDFFESGYSYGEQKEQPYGGYNYSQQYADYGQTAQQVPTYSYPSANTQGFYDSSTSYEYGGNFSYDYGASGPTTLSSGIGGGYGMEGSMKPRQTSEDYTSFEDEPPLLEGNNVASTEIEYAVTHIHGVTRKKLYLLYYILYFEIVFIQLNIVHFPSYRTGYQF